MVRTWLAAVLLWVVMALLLAPAALAASPAATPASTQDLTAGPPSGPWVVYTQGTGTRTAVEIWGDQASKVKGFTDAYQRSWDQTGQGLLDRVERFSSVFWSTLRMSESTVAAKQNKSHASYQDIKGFGQNAAYETTDPPDAQGFLTDTIVFTHGDYVAVVAIAAVGTIPRATLLDQATRQLDLLPAPVADYQAIGSGILLGGAIIIGAVVAVIVVAVIIVMLVFVRSRRRRPSPAGAYAAAGTAAGTAGAGVQLSSNGRYWWDGQAWQDTSVRMPPGVPISPDRAFWWDGAAWQPIPPGGGQAG